VERRITPLIIAVLLILPELGYSATTQQAIPDQLAYKQNIERERQDAIFDALLMVDPSLIDSDRGLIEGEVSAEDDRIQGEVKRLREARKKQFKYLTWTHIKWAINEDGVLAREQFLEQIEKNLASILERAIEVYIPAKIEQERVRLAKFRIVKAIRDLLPEYTITGNYKNGVLSGDSFKSDNWRMQFRQPIFRGGVLWNSIRLQLSNLEIARRSYDQAIGNLLAEVAEAYFEYERSQNVLRDQKVLFEKVSEQKRISDEKSKAGLISEIEELNTDSLYSQAQYDLENSHQELEIAMLELRKFLKLEGGDLIDVSGLYNLDEFEINAIQSAAGIPGIDGGEIEEDLESLIDMAYEYRPDLQVEASKLRAVHLTYRVAMGRRLPQFDALLEFGELAEAFLEDVEDPNHRHEFRIGLEMTWPLAGNTLKYTYDHDQRSPSVTQFLSGAGTRTRSNSFSFGFLDDLGQFASMTEAKINNLEQVVELEETEREVIREVKEAYYNFKKSLIQVESAYKRMGYRERLATLAKHRLDLNEVQISEYLQSEMDFTEERGLLYKALADFFLSKAQLNRAIGIRDYLMINVLT